MPKYKKKKKHRYALCGSARCVLVAAFVVSKTSKIRTSNIRFLFLNIATHCVAQPVGIGEQHFTASNFFRCFDRFVFAFRPSRASGDCPEFRIDSAVACLSSKAAVLVGSRARICEVNGIRVNEHAELVART